MSDEHKDRKASPWVPELDARRLAVLGKLGEELNEAGAITARCIIQGLDESEPTTHKRNVNALEDELADVYASIEIAIRRLGLDERAIHERARRKIAYLSDWHTFIAGTSFDLAVGPDRTVLSCRAAGCGYVTSDRVEMFFHLEKHGQPMRARG